MPDSRLSTNHLLSSLSQEDVLKLRVFSSEIVLEQGLVLYEAGHEIENVYFPESGIISLLAMMKDGTSVETASVDKSGAVGAFAGLGQRTTIAQAVVRTPARAIRISASNFRKVSQTSPKLREIVITYHQNLLAQAQTLSACNALHTVEERLSRVLLQTSDNSDVDVMPLTQELLSRILGVHRPSVTEAAKKLQRDGSIQYSRGRLEITSRQGLHQSACECYDTLKSI